MVTPLEAGLVGYVVGLMTSPLVYLMYSALMNTAEAVQQDVEAGD